MKVITLRLQDSEYRKISSKAKDEHRPISNYITTTVIKHMEESFYVDNVEMAQINSDEKLLGKLAEGHRQVKHGRGKLIE